MKAMVCELCGSNEIVKDGDYFICQSCGTKYTTEAAKKLMVDVSGSTVKIDESKTINSLIELAQNYYAAEDYSKAEETIDRALSIDTQNSILWQIKAKSYGKELDFDSFNPKSLLLACGNAISFASEEEKEQVAEDVATHAAKTLADTLWQGKVKYSGTAGKDSVSFLRSLEHGHDLFKAYVDIFDLPYMSKETCEKVLGQYQEFLSWGVSLSNGDSFAKSCSRLRNNKESYMDEMVSKIKAKYSDITIKETPPSSSGCYVATAVYGSYDCPEVWTLRRFRDYDLAETWYGRAFIRTYYAVSPTIVKWFGNTHWFNSVWKPVLDRMVLSLKLKGYEDTPYDDKQW